MTASASDDPEFNPYAAPKAEIVFEPYYQPTFVLDVYAGFWRRAAAFLLDSILLSVVTTLFNLVTQGVVTAAVMGRTQNEQMPYLVGVMLFNFAVNLAVYVGYFSVMESSRSQGTLGKMALGIKVTDLYGRRIPYSRALGRTAARYLSMMICYIGFLFAAFTERQQALHDMMVSTLVLRRN